MTFEELLNDLWMFDYEVFAHDTLMVAINYRSKVKMIFHNATADDYQNFIDTHHPILMGYNCRGYDKYKEKIV